MRSSSAPGALLRPCWLPGEQCLTVIIRVCSMNGIARVPLPASISLATLLRQRNLLLTSTDSERV